MVKTPLPDVPVNLRAEVLIAPLGNKKTGDWWFSSPELLGAQAAAVLAVRSGLSLLVFPVPADADHAAAIEHTATVFPEMVDALREAYAGRAFEELVPETPDDPGARIAMAKMAAVIAERIGGAVIKMPSGAVAVAHKGGDPDVIEIEVVLRCGGSVQ